MELKSFYPLMSCGEGTHLEGIRKRLIRSLETEGYEITVKCPVGISNNQWLASHLFFFFNDINLLYGSIQEKCTNFSCPYMSAGVNYEYLWVDNYKYKIPTRLPAKSYIDHLMKWISQCLSDKYLFPTGKNQQFLPVCVIKVKSIAKRYLRVYAHIYFSHIDALRAAGFDSMFIDSLSYFLNVVDMYSLIPIPDLRPLLSIINRIVPHLHITKALNEAEKAIEYKKSKLGFMKRAKQIHHSIKSHSSESSERYCTVHEENDYCHLLSLPVASSQSSHNLSSRSTSPEFSTVSIPSQEMLIDSTIESIGIVNGHVDIKEKEIGWDDVMKDVKVEEHTVETFEENCKCHIL